MIYCSYLFQYSVSYICTRSYLMHLGAGDATVDVSVILALSLPPPVSSIPHLHSFLTFITLSKQFSLHRPFFHSLLTLPYSSSLLYLPSDILIQSSARLSVPPAATYSLTYMIINIFLPKPFLRLPSLSREGNSISSRRVLLR